MDNQYQNISYKNDFLGYEQLSNEQKQLIVKAKEGKNILVDACIGSGKTTTIQILCNQFLNKKILYLTYNRLLKNDAKEKIKLPNVDVTNYHGFAFSCLRNMNIQSGIEDLIQNFLKYQPVTKSYDMIVIDEYQDIEQEIADMLVLIKKRNPNAQFIVVGDMQQKIYDKTNLDVKKFINNFFGEYECLSFTQCFRINKKLATQLSKVWEKKINGVNEDCKIKTMSLHKVIDYLGTKNPSNILCLGSKTGDMTTVLNMLEKKYNDKFNKNTVYASIRNNDEIINITNKTAIFTTYDSSKGMERPICVIFDFSLDYWIMRLNMPQQKYEILRNIFLVACSRGKKEIIFVSSKNSQQKRMKIMDIIKYKNNECNHDFHRPFYVSEMFFYKYKENIEKCYNLINKQKIETDNVLIDVKGTDALIDISQCIGRWQELIFFKNNTIEKEIRYLKEKLKESDKKFLYSKKIEDVNISLDTKILIITANNTRQTRYYNQVNTPFIPIDKQKDIIDRLSTEFTGEETTQKECKYAIPYNDEYNQTQYITISGRCDVVKNNIIYELKFKNALSHNDFLQLACYLALMNVNMGILWNTKTNEKYVVSVSDKNEFIKAVVNCITKGYVK